MLSTRNIRKRKKRKSGAGMGHSKKATTLARVFGEWMPSRKKKIMIVQGEKKEKRDRVSRSMRSTVGQYCTNVGQGESTSCREATTTGTMHSCRDMPQNEEQPEKRRPLRKVAKHGSSMKNCKELGDTLIVFWRGTRGTSGSRHDWGMEKPAQLCFGRQDNQHYAPRNGGGRNAKLI